MQSDKPSKPWRLASRLFGGASGTVFKGMATLALGSSAARLLGLAALPVLTRIYTPADFGALSVFTAFVQIVIPIATLRYMVALPLPRRDQTAFALLALSAGLAAALSVAVAAVLYIFGRPFLELFSMEMLAPYWWLVGLGMLGASLYELLTMWATRKRAYHIIAQTQLTQSAIGEGVKLVLGLLEIKPLGLMIGQVAGHSGGLRRLIISFGGDFRRLAPNLTRRHIAMVASHYSSFPAYRLPAQLLLVLSMQAPLLFTAALYNPETTGQMGMATMAMLLPMSIIGYNVSKALYAEVVAIKRGNTLEIRRLVRGVSFKLFPITLLICIFLFFFATKLSVLALGAEWQLSGQIMSILSILLFFQFFSSPFIEILNVIGSQKLILALYFRQLLFYIMAGGLAKYFSLSVVEYTICTTVLLSIHYLMFTLRLHYMLRIK